jgi:hypothetical protein
MKTFSQQPRGLAHARGMALVEVLISSAITAVLFVAAVVTASSARITRQRSMDDINGRQLARTLLIEISKRAYKDPTGLATDALGRDSGETANVRSTWDDIDDYTGYSQSPPTDLAGVTLIDSTWRWTVTVTRVSDLAGTASSSETGFKRIQIDVYHGQRIAGRVINIRTAGGG